MMPALNKSSCKALLERKPQLYLTLLRIKRFGHWSQRWVVSKETDITIEGFPRSSNSFARAAFMAAQPEKLRIATHVHSAAQVRHSAKLGIPTMVLLRAPADACLSLVALDYEISGISANDISITEATQRVISNLQAYERFYQDTLKVYDQIVVAEFSMVTSNYAEVIQRLNQRYQTEFALYENSPENDAQLFDKGGFHLSPNPQRNAIKDTMRSILGSDSVQPALRCAESVYKQLIELEQKRYPSRSS